MHNFGFFRVRSCVPAVKIGNPVFNGNEIVKEVIRADKEHVECIVFPELSVTGYTCADLFQQHLLSSQAEKEVITIADKTKHCNCIFALGAPVETLGKRFNCAIVIAQGKILAIIPKSFLPNYGEFYEKRWFESGFHIQDEIINYGGKPVSFGTDVIVEYNGIRIGIEICEDLWVPQPPSSALAMAGADVILNLSASDDLIGKFDYLSDLISQQSARCRCAYVYSSAGWGESSTDLVFSGKAMIGEDGKLFGDRNRFETHPFSLTRDIDIQKLRSDRLKYNTFVQHDRLFKKYRIVTQTAPINLTEDIINADIDPQPFVPRNVAKLDERCEEIINIQSYGLMKRLEAIGCKKAVVGISGGLDSTLALLVTVNAFDRLDIPRKGIIGVTMPGLATTSRTKNNANVLMQELGVTVMEIPIGEAVRIHFRDIGQDDRKYDATYENSQARERTQILMDLANKENGIVIGTGDMSELALGWCTYNGDQMSMYGVNASVPKTLVRHLVNWFASKSSDKVANVLRDICDTPISPELIPASSDEIGQKTEDLVGPYELHDFFLYNFLRNSFTPDKIYFLAKIAFRGVYEEEEILKWLKVFIKRFFSQQFKRSCMPDGPKVGSVNLSPRGDWRMPSDASPELWLSSIEDIKNQD